MKQRIKTVLAVILCVLAAVAAAGFIPAETHAEETGEEQVLVSGDYSYTVNGDGTAVITAYSGGSTDVTVPSELDGHQVTVIGREAFMGNEQIKVVKLPDSVRTIGSRAFSGCISMKSMNPGSGLSDIRYKAFYDCISLSDVTVPEGVTDIGGSAFYGCLSLTDIRIPGTVETLSAYTFSGCRRLDCVYIDNGVGCIGQNAFAYCSSLKTISFPDSVTETGPGVFYNCVALADVELSENLTMVADEMFYGCSNLKNIELPDGIVSIGEGGFYSCRSMKSINLLESLATIGTKAFYNCRSLERVYLPENVYKLGEYSFGFCKRLKNINIPEGVASIPDKMFYADRCLTSVKLPDSLVRIGSNAFFNCDKLKSIRLPDGLVSIGVCAFEWCESIRKITIPDSVAYIGSKAFDTDHNGIIIYCRCGSYAEDYAVNNDMDFAGSDYSSKITPARIGRSGRMTVKCKKCGKTILKKTVPEIASVKLIQNNYRYTGSTIDPYMNIRDSKGRHLKRYTDFNIKHVSDGRRTGKQTIKIIFKERYAGTSTRHYKIVSSLKKPELKAKRSGKCTVKLSWKDVSGAKGYKIYVKEPGSSRYRCRITKKASVRSVIHKGLKRGRTYRYKIRAYKITNGTTEYGPYSSVKTVRIK